MRSDIARAWRNPDPDAWIGFVAVALTSLACILLLAVGLRNGAGLEYDDSGSGCRSLTDDSARALMWAMVPVRVLLAGWLVVSALGLAGKLSADEPGRLGRVRAVAGIGAAVLTAALMAFVGTIPLIIVWAVVILWPLSLAAIVVVCLRAPVSRRRWLWLTCGWIVLSGVMLPLVLAISTRSGEIPIC